MIGTALWKINHNRFTDTDQRAGSFQEEARLLDFSDIGTCKRLRVCDGFIKVSLIVDRRSHNFAWVTDGAKQLDIA